MKGVHEKSKRENALRLESCEKFRNTQRSIEKVEPALALHPSEQELLVGIVLGHNLLSDLRERRFVQAPHGREFAGQLPFLIRGGA